MIPSFRHKGIKLLYEKGDQRILLELDLGPIIMKATDTGEGHGWFLGFAPPVRLRNIGESASHL